MELTASNKLRLVGSLRIRNDFGNNDEQLGCTLANCARSVRSSVLLTHAHCTSTYLLQWLIHPANHLHHLAKCKWCSTEWNSSAPAAMLQQGLSTDPDYKVDRLWIIAEYRISHTRLLPVLTPEWDVSLVSGVKWLLVRLKSLSRAMKPQWRYSGDLGQGIPLAEFLSYFCS